MRSTSKPIQAVDTSILYGTIANDTLSEVSESSHLYHYAQATHTVFVKIQELGFEEWLLTSDEEEMDSPSDHSLLPLIDQLGFEAWLAAAQDSNLPCLLLGSEQGQTCQHTKKPHDLLALINRLGFETWLLDWNIASIAHYRTVVPNIVPPEIQEFTAAAQIQTSVYHSYMQAIEWVGYLYYQAGCSKKMQDFILHADPLLLYTWHNFTVTLLGEKKRLVENYPQLHQEGFCLGVIKGLEKLKAQQVLTSSTLFTEEESQFRGEERISYYAYVLGSAWVLGQYYHQQELGQPWDDLRFPNAFTLQAVWSEMLSILPIDKKQEIIKHPDHYQTQFCAGALAGMTTLQQFNTSESYGVNNTPPLLRQLTNKPKPSKVGVLMVGGDEEKYSSTSANSLPLDKEETTSPLLTVPPSGQNVSQQVKARSRTAAPALPLPHPPPLGKAKKENIASVKHALPVFPHKIVWSFLRRKGQTSFDTLLTYIVWSKRRVGRLFYNVVKKPLLTLLTLVRSSTSAAVEKVRTARRPLLHPIHTIKNFFVLVLPFIVERVAHYFTLPNVLPVSLELMHQTRAFFQRIRVYTEKLGDEKDRALTIHRPAVQDFESIKRLDLSFLPVSRPIILALNHIAPELEELHLQGSQFKAWERGFVHQVMTGQFTSLRLLNVMQTNLSEHSLLQILQAVQQNKLPRLETLGMDLFSFPVAQRYRQLLFAGKYTALPLARQQAPDFSASASTIQLDLRDVVYTPAIILRVLLNYLNLGLLQSIVDIQLAGRTLDRSIVALLSMFPALKVLNIADSHYGSCRAFALFSQLAEQGAWEGIDLQATGSVFDKALSK